MGNWSSVQGGAGVVLCVWAANIITKGESVMGGVRFRGTGNAISFGWGKVMLRVELLVLVLTVIVWLLWLWLF